MTTKISTFVSSDNQQTSSKITFNSARDGVSLQYECIFTFPIIIIILMQFPQAYRNNCKFILLSKTSVSSFNMANNSLNIKKNTI